MRLCAVSYNIHKCVGGLDRRYDPERIAAAIAPAAPDFVLMQEVTCGWKRSEDRQVDVLGEHLGLRHRVYFPNVLKRHGEYGNAILSRYPLYDANNIDLTVGPKKARSVLHARCRVRSKTGKRSRTIHLFNLHLGLSGIERKIQLRRFLASDPFARLEQRTPILVGGDFNDVWGTLGVKLLEPAGFRGQRRPLRTFPAYAPVRALDAIYVRGEIQIEKVRTPRTAIARRASDHLPLIAELRVAQRRR